MYNLYLCASRSMVSITAFRESPYSNIVWPNIDELKRQKWSVCGFLSTAISAYGIEIMVWRPKVDLGQKNRYDGHFKSQAFRVLL